MSSEIIILFLTGIGWLIGQWILKNRELEYKHFEQKAKVYQKYLSSFIKSVIDIKKGNSLDLKELQSTLMQFKETVLIWGDSRMIKDFLKYQVLLDKLEEDPYNPIRTMDFLERMIRRDLGHNDFLLKEGELAQIFLEEDVKKILKRKKRKILWNK